MRLRDEVVEFCEPRNWLGQPPTKCADLMQRVHDLDIALTKAKGQSND